MKTILIADDDEQNLYLLHMLLTDNNYRVVSAGNGAEGLALARDERPDLIISDVLMPHLDGYSFCRECRRDRRLRNTPFMFYTAEFTDSKDRSLAKSLGVEYVLIKPADPDLLLDAVRTLLLEPGNRTSIIHPSESSYQRVHQEVLLRKLEEKMAQVEAANRHLFGLQQAGAAISGSLGLAEVLQRIGRGAIEALDSTLVWILVSDPTADKQLQSEVLLGVCEGHVLALEDALGLRAPALTTIENHNWLTDVLWTREPIVIADLAHSESVAPPPTVLSKLGKLLNLHSLVILPMLAKSEHCAGVIVLGHERPGRIADAELRLLDAFAHQAAIAIDNARLFDKVERSEQRYRRLLENSADAIVALDKDLHITDWNIGAERMFGFAPEELRRQPFAHLLATPETTSFSDVAAIAYRSGCVRGWRSRLRHHAGAILEIELTIIYLGEADGYTAIITDITERLEKETQLAQAQKMEALGQLVGGIAHDFNNLLTVILGNLHFLQDTLKPEPHSEVAELLEDALSASQDGAQLTNRLRSFSRRQDLSPQRLDIAELITDFSRLIRRTIGHNIELCIDTDRKLEATRADRANLESALLNLCINARDAMPQGGRLTIRADVAAIYPSNTQSELDLAAGRYVRISVSDTGTGIPKEIIDRIYEPFFTTKPAGKGSGIGLSMVYGFAKQSGGKLSIASEYGHGATFTLLLPVTGEQDIAVSHSPRNPVLPGGTETILVVEDEHRIRRFAVRSLQELGYRVLECEHATAALALLEQNPAVDLLFSDVFMPGELNGRQLAQRCLELYPAMRVVMTTSHQEALDALQSDAAKVLQKPYSKQELAVAVRSSLDDNE